MSVKVYIPSHKDGNPFFDEIMAHSQCRFTFGGLEVDIQRFDVVLVHWPELIFNWKEPTPEQLNLLETKLHLWKGQVKIVYVVHNEHPHKGASFLYSRLYQLILNNCDVMVHLGHYSLERYQVLFPKVSHRYIPHPLYTGTFQIYDKFEARRQLNIPKDKKVLVVPGKIRTKTEKRFVLQAFDTLSVNDKFLIVPRMFEKPLPFKVWVPYRLRHAFKINEWLTRLYNLHFDRRCMFRYAFQDVKFLSLVMSAADVVLIPREQVLNSGNLFLGLTYGKPVVGPAVGNLTEVLERFQMPLFDPANAVSVQQALMEAFAMTESPLKETLLKPFLPETVTKEWDNLLTGGLI